MVNPGLFQVTLDGFRQFDMEEIRARYGSQHMLTRTTNPFVQANAELSSQNP